MFFKLLDETNSIDFMKSILTFYNYNFMKLTSKFRYRSNVLFNNLFLRTMISNYDDYNSRWKKEKRNIQLLSHNKDINKYNHQSS